MGAGKRILWLMPLATSVQPVTTALAETAWTYASGVAIGVWILAYLVLGACAWGTGRPQALPVFFLVGVAAILGSIVDINLHPTLGGVGRNLWPLEFIFNAVVTWVPLCIGAVVRHFVSGGSLLEDEPNFSSSGRASAPRAELRRSTRR
jgi:hypothetical protein